MFDRLERLIGKENLNKLHTKTVAVVGVGGVGGYALETLIRNGIENIIIVDADTIDITNKNRQIIALDSNLNMKKVDAFEKRIKDINPKCNVTKYDVFLNEETKKILFNNKIDYLVDSCDTVTTKIMLIGSSIRLAPQLLCGLHFLLDRLRLTMQTADKLLLCLFFFRHIIYGVPYARL